jgi:hypothetical protein
VATCGEATLQSKKAVPEGVGRASPACALNGANKARKSEQHNSKRIDWK